MEVEMEEIVRMKPSMVQVQRSATTSHQSSSLVRDQNDIPSERVIAVHYDINFLSLCKFPNDTIMIIIIIMCGQGVWPCLQKKLNFWSKIMCFLLLFMQCRWKAVFKGY